MVKQLSTIPVTYPMIPNASEVPLVPQPIAQPPVSPVSACAGIPPSGPGSPSFVKQTRSGRDFWSMTTPTPAADPPGSPSSSSSSDGKGQPFGWPGRSPGGHGPPSSQASGSPNRQWHSIGIGSSAAFSEDAVYKYKSLQNIKIGSLPKCRCVQKLEKWSCYQTVLHGHHRTGHFA